MNEKDLPDVVEKVVDSLKITDLKTLQEKLDQAENLSEIKEGISSVEKNVSKHIQDASSKISMAPAVIQGIIMDSVSSSSKQSELEHMDEINKFKIKNSPTVSAADLDSLRTSSPDSEIEEALANNNDQNPPTPKPTFSELQNLVVGPVNNMLKSFAKPSEAQVVEKNPASDNSDNTFLEVLK
ncbi:uncharacterized protein LOC129912045 isoform X2 [Episyrphus balteatus]|uniref:uncharacterized protein LOC129912045 isoform X2 n=1 Tax=Episyrphus balteatus TaxID=286459 RepID=UPI002486C3E9|nr:uncharacterized protein LOC129912045 isoform X2 [Episyrphus balteatus]